MTRSTSLRSNVLEQRPINRFGPLDYMKSPVRVVEYDKIDTIQQYLPLPVKQINELLTSAHPRYDISSMTELPINTREQILRTMLFPADDRIIIVDVEPLDGHIMSGQPFKLRVYYAYSEFNPPRIARATVQWAGEPFFVESYITIKDLKEKYVDIIFDERQTLPTGSATFFLQLFSHSGSKSSFRITCAILPSNPFDLILGPDSEYVTGTWSARGARHGDAFDTGVAVTLMNGDPVEVSVNSRFHWRFWNGGIGGTIVEEGDGDFNTPITVPGFGTWGGWISFHSPSGSGIYNLYNSKEDMTIEIAMTRADGGTVSGSITARTMFLFGINITQVAGEDFTSQEHTDLFAAATVTRTIYERRDITFITDDRYIPLANVGPYEIITSAEEFHNLCSDWSGPDSNNNIDAFIVQTVAIPSPSGGIYDGIDGSIPGPTSHDGPDSGVTAGKNGYIDPASGVKRLSIDYLGMLIGHEIGHYLGLEHISEAGNLMLWNSHTNDTGLNYDQYRIMINHGWVAID